MNMKNKGVVLWLFTGCLLLFIMVVVGGITRLTNSGLSMTDWHLVTDTFPPLTQQKWEEAYTEYQKFPEYQKINQFKNFTLDDYKYIYFWEWFHRFIGRIIGLVFIIPFVYFLIKKKLTPSLIKQCALLLFMGGFQGFLGWYMVKSGLIDRPDVSHFRLSIHLTFALLTFAVTLNTGLNAMYPEKRKPIIPLRNLTRWIIVLLFIQIIYGGFVAGLDAGKIHTTWPTMNEGQWIHESVFIEQKTLFLNFTEGKSGVQFIHRTLAIIVFSLILYLFIQRKKFNLDRIQLNAINLTLILVIVQFALGVFTLLYSVPISLGVLHQAGAFFLLSSITFTMHRLSK
ncbi:MAG: COX15/CtaA family protein [Flavobacteriales bacterium]|nr:COX15/CtaA family protein [Flavobacteriales bacterium]